ncbi:hypothetical protein [Marinobacter sp.]|uniref:hypothetical protein n=1 Tax=Marinobacter sp. TaxID=50741 RepID=UPI003A8E07AE
MTTCEGGVPVPMMVRWPGKIPANRVLSGIQTHMDIYTTLAAAAGEPDIAEKVLKNRGILVKNSGLFSDHQSLRYESRRRIDMC